MSAEATGDDGPAEGPAEGPVGGLGLLAAKDRIRRLKTGYALAADDRQGCSVNVARMMPLFSKQAVWDGRPRFGVYRGIDAVRQMFVTAPARIDWSLHYMVEQFVDVDPGGATATGCWYLLELARMKSDEAPDGAWVWIAGVYNDAFVFEDDDWKFSVVGFDCQVILPATDQSIAPMMALASRGT